MLLCSFMSAVGGICTRNPARDRIPSPARLPIFATTAFEMEQERFELYGRRVLSPHPRTNGYPTEIRRFSLRRGPPLLLPDNAHAAQF